VELKFTETAVSPEVADGGKKLNVKGNVAFISKTQAWVKIP